jgi:hypothetical protein
MEVEIILNITKSICELIIVFTIGICSYYAGKLKKISEDYQQKTEIFLKEYEECCKEYCKEIKEYVRLVKNEITKNKK